MEIILISIRQLRDIFFEEPSGQTFVALSLLRGTNSEFKNEIEPFWVKIRRGFVAYIAREIRTKMIAIDLLNSLADKKAGVVDMVFFLTKDGRFVINTSRTFSKIVFLKLRKFILKDKLPLEKEFRILFPSAPELTKDLRWKSEYRFRSPK